MPTEDVINSHFVQTVNEIHQFKRLNLCLVYSLKCSIYIMTFC